MQYPPEPVAGLIVSCIITFIVGFVALVVLAVAGGHWGYERAKAAGNPILGYSSKRKAE